MTKKIRPSRFVLGIASILTLAACGQDSSPVSSTTSPDQGGDVTTSRDENNFVTADKVITESRLVSYPGPSLMASSKAVDISVEGVPQFVYDTRVNHGRVFSWTAPTTTNPVSIFDFEGKVHVEIKVKGDIKVEKAVVRPLEYAYPCSVKDNVISFDLTSNGNYVVEYNDDPSNAIHLFANEIETNPVTPEMASKDPNMIYVGPGVYNAGAFPLTDNSTVYLAGGAYVYGQFAGDGLNNVTIRGRGIVAGDRFTRNNDADKTIPLEMKRVTNLNIEGVTFLDPAGWTLHIQECKDVLIKDVKIVTARSNGDGISLQSCQNVEVDGGFVRSWDDSLVVKNVFLKSTANIDIHDVVVWTDLAQSMEVGYETYGATMDNISFHDITVLHNFHKAVISCHNSDQAEITNLSYKNITIEDASCLGDNQEDGENDFFMDFTVQYSPEWTHSEGERGSIKGVEISNVKVLKKAPTCVARIRGESATSTIEDIKISGLKVEGQLVDSDEDIGLTKNEFVKNVTYPALAGEVRGHMIKLPYSLGAGSENVVKTIVAEVPQEGMIVPEFAKKTGDLPYIGEKKSIDGLAASTHGVGAKSATPADDGSGPFLKEGSEAQFAFDNDPATEYVAGDWKGQDDEFAALTYDFAAPTEVGEIRIKGDEKNPYSYVYRIAIYCKKLRTDGTMSDKYRRLYASVDYEMTPATGNVIDIPIGATIYGGLQLRFFKTDGLGRIENYRVSEVEFYPPSLTLNKAIVDATEHNDVYPVGKINDGDVTGTSYYESKKLPAHVVIDLGEVHQLQALVLALNPSILWSPRTQNIAVGVSDQNIAYNASSISYKALVEKQDMVFDPATGNSQFFSFASPIAARYLRIDIYSNSAPGGYGGQLAEIAAYGA